MGDIVFKRARIAAVGHRYLSSSALVSRIKLIAAATVETKQALISAGFDAFNPDFRIASVRAVHTVGGISTIKTDSDLVNRFKLFRERDANSKEKRLMLSFVVEHIGCPFEIVEHFMKIGEGEGTCTLTPLQSEMFPDESEEKRKVEEAND